MSKIKGFTLIEMMITIGIISLATIGVYAVYGRTSEENKSNDEAQELNNLIDRIERSVSINGVFTGINKTNLDTKGGSFVSNYNLDTIVSPSASILDFNYENMSNIDCSKFVTKMLSNPGNIKAIVNSENIQPGADPSLVSIACQRPANKVTIELNSNIPSTSLVTVVPSPASPPSGPPSPTPPPSWSVALAPNPSGPTGPSSPPTPPSPPVVVTPPSTPPIDLNSAYNITPSTPMTSGCMGYIPSLGHMEFFGGGQSDVLCTSYFQNEVTTCPPGSFRSHWTRSLFYRRDYMLSPTAPGATILLGPDILTETRDDSSTFCNHDFNNP